MQRFDDYDFDQDDNATSNKTQRSAQREPSKPQAKSTSVRYSRRGAAPAVYNGMHRRRQRRIMW